MHSFVEAAMRGFWLSPNVIFVYLDGVVLTRKGKL
jgi:hypothetical protein